MENLPEEALQWSSVPVQSPHESSGHLQLRPRDVYVALPRREASLSVSILGVPCHLVARNCAGTIPDVSWPLFLLLPSAPSFPKVPVLLEWLWGLDKPFFFFFFPWFSGTSGILFFSSCFIVFFLLLAGIVWSINVLSFDEVQFTYFFCSLCF